ncbi:MAG: lycopene cyclase domain-containing protein [Anaerolineae bacterium]|nr:lycopene cyclase domain-containing protein [Anaerolineae bacterium]
MENLTYLLLLVIWLLPILLLQWLVAGDILLSRWKMLVPGVLFATVYLTCIDALAFNSGIWTLNPALTMGINIPILNTPIEAGLFYFLSCALIAQTLVMLVAHEFMRQRIATLIDLLRRTMQGDKTKNPPE